MIKTLISAVLLIWCIQSKAKNVFHHPIANNNHSIFRLAETDSSNYKIKILKPENSYSQIIFTIVDEQNNPLGGTISLNGADGKSKSGLSTNDDGKIFVMVSDDAIKHLVVTRIGYGRVVIPIEKVKNKAVEIRIQLYPFATTN